MNIRDNPKSPSGYRALLINLALGGDAKEAQHTLRQLKSVAPGMSQHWITQNAVWSGEDAMKRYREAFLIAGLK